MRRNDAEQTALAILSTTLSRWCPVRAPSGWVGGRGVGMPWRVLASLALAHGHDAALYGASKAALKKPGYAAGVASREDTPGLLLLHPAGAYRNVAGVQRAAEC